MLYWIFTILFGGFMLFTAIPNIMVNADSIALISTHLGYPKYFIGFIGVAKLLGALVVLIPGIGRLKDWAYAGLIFDLTGAWYSTIAVGDPPGPPTMFMLPTIIVGLLSYYYWRKRSVALRAAS